MLVNSKRSGSTQSFSCVAPVPYAMNNITNVLQIRCRRDYYQTEWPRRTRAYEYGVYTDQVLQNFFMPGMYVLTNLSPA